jgi:hypothetical protein
MTKHSTILNASFEKRKRGGGYDTVATRFGPQNEGFIPFVSGEKNLNIMTTNPI